MNSIFLRIYGGMCAALILVALLGVLALHLLNDVRSGQYRERLAHGTFALMGDNLQPMSAIERQRALAVLESPAQVPPALLERLSEPLFGLYSETADRVLAVGAPGLGLTLRRRLVDLLGTLAVRKSEAQQLLVVALTDLADDLRGLGRAAEAEQLGGDEGGGVGGADSGEAVAQSAG